MVSKQGNHTKRNEFIKTCYKESLSQHHNMYLEISLHCIIVQVMSLDKYIECSFVSSFNALIYFSL